MRSRKSSLLGHLAIPAFSTLLLASCTSAGPSAADGDAIASTGGVQSSIACRDLNGDAFSALVVTSPASARLSIFINQGNGSFAAPVAYTNAVNGQTAGIG
ncbi:hypothetical protein BE11_13160 [Sorangium cellulosum]|nr:hypothetical protein BE11_13160 [Sorangium cellulosum]